MLKKKREIVLDTWYFKLQLTLCTNLVPPRLSQPTTITSLSTGWALTIKMITNIPVGLQNRPCWPAVKWCDISWKQATTQSEDKDARQRGNEPADSDFRPRRSVVGPLFGMFNKIRTTSFLFLELEFARPREQSEKMTFSITSTSTMRTRSQGHRCLRNSDHSIYSLLGFFISICFWVQGHAQVWRYQLS